MLFQCLKKFNLFDKLVENYENLKNSLTSSQKKWLNIPKAELFNILDNNSNFVSSNLTNIGITKKMTTNESKDTQFIHHTKKKSITLENEDKFLSSSTIMFPIAQKMNLMHKNQQIPKKENVIQTAESNLKVVEMLKKYKQFKDNSQQIKDFPIVEKHENNSHNALRSETKSNLLAPNSKIHPKILLNPNPSKDNRIKLKIPLRKTSQLVKNKPKHLKLKKATNKDLKGTLQEENIKSENSQLKNLRKSLNDLETKKGCTLSTGKANLKNETVLLQSLQVNKYFKVLILI